MQMTEENLFGPETYGFTTKTENPQKVFIANSNKYYICQIPYQNFFKLNPCYDLTEHGETG